MTKKQVIFGDVGRLRMLDGMKKLHDAVAGTLGPKGRNVVFSKSYGPPQVANDGTLTVETARTDPTVAQTCHTYA